MKINFRKLVKERLYEYGDSDSPENYSDKKGYHIDIETETISNTDFRRVLYTGENLQLVLMSLEPGEDIGIETHENDQFFRFDKGTGIVIINGIEYSIKDGDSIIVPAGAEHNIIADKEVSLKMYTIYAPPHHKDGVVYNTKQEAEIDSEEYDGITTE